jgi:hypothetical protein
MRKAELSINVIIVAAIALLVLVILGVIFMGNMANFNFKKSDCTTNNGQCVYGDGCPEGMMNHPSAYCHNSEKKVDEYRVCCTPLNG